MSARQLNQSLKQLNTVSRWEADKTQRAANAYQIAQQYVDEQRLKLQSLEQYRLDYMRQVQQNGKQGLEARNYNQHLAFVSKLDKACEQQTAILSKATLAADQRKRQWLQQQQKEKAVTTLIDKKHAQLGVIHARQEQNLMDEFATQKFLRQAALKVR